MQPTLLLSWQLPAATRGLVADSVAAAIAQRERGRWSASLDDQPSYAQADRGWSQPGTPPYRSSISRGEYFDEPPCEANELIART